MESGIQARKGRGKGKGGPKCRSSSPVASAAWLPERGRSRGEDLRVGTVYERVVLGLDGVEPVIQVFLNRRCQDVVAGGLLDHFVEDFLDLQGRDSSPAGLLFDPLPPQGMDKDSKKT